MSMSYGTKQGPEWPKLPAIILFLVLSTQFLFLFCRNAEACSNLNCMVPLKGQSHEIFEGCR